LVIHENNSRIQKIPILMIIASYERYKSRPAKRKAGRVSNAELPCILPRELGCVTLLAL
jgi:hypothetical protein